MKDDQLQELEAIHGALVEGTAALSVLRTCLLAHNSEWIGKLGVSEVVCALDLAMERVKGASDRLDGITSA